MAKRPPLAPEGALYVRLPAHAVDKLDRAAHALGVHKKDLVAGLVSKYVDPDSQRGLNAMGALSPPRRVTVELGDEGAAAWPTPRWPRARHTLGSYSFHPHDPPEVMNAAQAAELLQLEEKVVLELAESGKLPGRKISNAWRFSRAAVIAWLSSPE